MRCCWGDVARTTKLKQALQEAPRHEDEPAAPRKASQDSSAGSRTSCSSHEDTDLGWDDLSASEADDDNCERPSSTEADTNERPATTEGDTSERPATTEPDTSERPATTEGDSAERPQPTSSRVRPLVRPLLLGPPSEYDLRSTAGLMRCLNSLARLATPEELGSKHLAISELQRLVDAWLRAAFGRAGDVTATLLFGGSWHLKVGLADSDLDVVALLPRFVQPARFFGSLADHLRASAGVAKLVARTKATVPILSFQLNGVHIDLLFARYTQDVVPRHVPVHSDRVLEGMDAASIRSLSVPRVASLVLELVPDGSVFRACLRIIRLWAARRGIYSNKQGFLGGISWTILVAFVCQMFPHAAVSSVVHRFFTVLSTWSWPAPILLTKPYENPRVTACDQWSPLKHHHDRAHLMPIISPGFPAVNTAVNVNHSTMRVLMDEFARGKRIMDELQSRGHSGSPAWVQLFEPTEFLVRYDHHVVIELRADSEDALGEWADFVASRTRKLVETLQHTSPIRAVHPLPELLRPQAAGPSPNVNVDADAEARGYFLIAYTIEAPPPSRQTILGRRNSSAMAQVCNELARTCVGPAARYFSATELTNVPEKKANMHADVTYQSWQDLPDAIFPDGRSAAAGDRARYLLSKVHNLNLAMGFGR